MRVLAKRMHPTAQSASDAVCSFVGDDDLDKEFRFLSCGQCPFPATHLDELEDFCLRRS